MVGGVLDSDEPLHSPPRTEGGSLFCAPPGGASGLSVEAMRPAASYPSGASLVGLQLPPEETQHKADAPECTAVGRVGRSCRVSVGTTPELPHRSLNQSLQDMGLSTSESSGLRPSPRGPSGFQRFSMQLPPMLPPEEIERMKTAGLSRTCTPVDPQCPATTTPESFPRQLSSS